MSIVPILVCLRAPVQLITLFEQDAAASGAYNLVTDGDAIYGAYEFMVKQDSSFSFSSEFMLNGMDNYWQPFVNAWMPSQWNEDLTEITFENLWGWEILAGTEMINNYYYFDDLDGDGEFNEKNVQQRLMTWQLSSDGLFSFSGYWNCDCAEVDMLCHVRTWTPLAEIDQGFYVIEQAKMRGAWNYVEGSDEGYGLYFPTRIGVYKQYSKPTLWQSETASAPQAQLARMIIYPSS